MDCRYPYEVAAPIDIIEGTLRSSMEKAGVNIDQPITPVSIEFMDADTTATHPVKVKSRTATIIFYYTFISRLISAGCTPTVIALRPLVHRICEWQHRG